MSFTIISDVSKQYLLEEDAIKGFRMAVENGQSRLALQILTDIIDVFADIFAEALSEEDTSETVVEEQKVQQAEINSGPSEEPVVQAEEKRVQTKPAVKKEAKTSEEK